jgi:hypothetical protein
MQYNVLVHSHLTDDVIELPGTVVSKGDVTMHPIYAEVQKFVFNVAENDAEEFAAACERLDAVAMYWPVSVEETEAEKEAAQAADLEPLSELRISEIAELLDMSDKFVDTFCHADWGDPNHRAWLHTSTNRAIANWILACTR